MKKNAREEKPKRGWKESWQWKKLKKIYIKTEDQEKVSKR